MSKCFVSFLCCWKKQKKKRKWNRQKTLSKSVLKVVIEKWEKSKNWFLAKLPDTICQEARRNAHFVHAFCFGKKFVWPQAVKTKKNYKNSGFSGNCPKPKMTPFFGKRCFLAWVKKWFLMHFRELCFPESTNFIAFSAKHSSCNKKDVDKDRKFMKNSGLFLNMAKVVFCLFFDWFFFVFLLFLFFWGGFKGQVRWPEGPPHLAGTLLAFLFLFSFLCFCI